MKSIAPGLIVSALRTRLGSTSTTSSRLGKCDSARLDTTQSFFASHLGLDPSHNRFHSPLVYHEEYSFLDWPDKHTFPMNKFARLAHALLNNCQATSVDSSLPRPLVREPSDFFRPLDFTDAIQQDWLKSHGPIDPAFIQRFLNAELSEAEARRIGFPLDQIKRPELIRRTVVEVAGTVLTCQLACRYGLAANLAGGTHHAHPAHGSGYTIINDAAVATHVITSSPPQQNGMNVQRVLVVDCDVHQGDGTAQFCHHPTLQGKLWTLSLHCVSNYPHVKALSTIDVGLRDGIRDDEYMESLENSMDKALDAIQPDFVIYNAGVDIYEHDRLGRLKVSEAGIRRRDRFVVERCVNANIAVAAVIGGGYDKDVDTLARRHGILHEECAYVWRKYQMWKQL